MNSIIDEHVQSSGGSVWHELHSEREELCETLLKTTTLNLPSPTQEWHRALLQWRLHKIDGALDRLMAGPYGKCRNCGRPVDEFKLSLDAAIEFCVDCWEKIQTNDAIERANATSRFDGSASETFTETIGGIDPSSEGIAIQTLNPLDTILVSTRNSDYRIFLLDPETGRALVQGGKHFVEPIEALIVGSVLKGRGFKVGWICIGMHLEIATNDSVTRTSPVESLRIETHAALN